MRRLAVGTRKDPPSSFRVAEWLKQPRLFVTRGELWVMIEHYDRARRAAEQENAWWRRLLRMWLAPLFRSKLAARVDLQVAGERPQERTPSGDTGQ